MNYINNINNEDTIIEYINIFKSYNKKNVINNFNLKINKGEFVSLVGLSGCGKTTLLKMINGLNDFDSGQVLISKEDIKKQDIINIRRKIGYCMQKNTLFPHMTVEQNLIYKLNIDYKKDKEYLNNKIFESLEKVRLKKDVLKMYPDEISGGQQQRVSIARAICTDPDILLMDEPFSSIDAITKSEIHQNIKQIHNESNMTILFVTHDINEAIYLSTKLLIINDGELCQYDSVENILSNPKNDFVKNLMKIKLKTLN